MKLKALGLALLSLLLAAGACLPAPVGQAQEAYTRYSRTELNVFNTDVTLIGFAQSQEDFDRVSADVFSRLRDLDRIFDAYNGYEGLHNLYYVNRRAAQEPVEIPQPLFDLISWCRNEWDQGLRSANIAMGAVLSIWHEYREQGNADPENAQLPPMEDLIAANGHVQMENVVLDSEKQTVFFSDPDLTLDIGAVAKGYAADAVLPYLYEAMPSFLLSLGGSSVYAGRPPMDGRAAWAVGVQDPQTDAFKLAMGGSEILDVVDVTDLSVVTSGDYWRYYTVDGVRYHHIIDPVTLMPSRQVLSVTVICESSTLADFLSTTLFVLSFEEGLALVESLEGVEALWVLPDGSIQASPGMIDFARKLK